MASRLRVWMIVNPPNEPEYFYVGTPQEAIRIIDRETKNNMRTRFITEDAFGLEEQDTEDGEWYEWYNEDGMDILEVMEGN